MTGLLSASDAAVAKPLTAHLPNEVAPTTGDDEAAGRRDRIGLIERSMFVLTSRARRLGWRGYESWCDERMRWSIDEEEVGDEAGRDIATRGFLTGGRG
jgi:hypothetical protein